MRWRTHFALSFHRVPYHPIPTSMAGRGLSDPTVELLALVGGCVARQRRTRPPQSLFPSRCQVVPTILLRQLGCRPHVQPGVPPEANKNYHRRPATTPLPSRGLPLDIGADVRLCGICLTPFCSVLSRWMAAGAQHRFVRQFLTESELSVVDAVHV